MTLITSRNVPSRGGDDIRAWELVIDAIEEALDLDVCPHDRGILAQMHEDASWLACRGKRVTVAQVEALIEREQLAEASATGGIGSLGLSKEWVTRFAAMGILTIDALVEHVDAMASEGTLYSSEGYGLSGGAMFRRCLVAAGRPLTIDVEAEGPGGLNELNLDARTADALLDQGLSTVAAVRAWLNGDIRRWVRGVGKVREGRITAAVAAHAEATRNAEANS